MGCLRPGIVLYNENHWSGDSIAKAQTSDSKKKPDCEKAFNIHTPSNTTQVLIVMGTSLKVHGLKQLVKGFARTIHQNNQEIIGNPRKMPGSVVFVNATPAGGKEWSQDFDYFVHGTSDDFVHNLVEQWKSTRPQDWQIQTKITQSHRSTKKTALSAAKTAAKAHDIPIDAADNVDKCARSQPVSVAVGFPQVIAHTRPQPPPHTSQPIQESNRITPVKISNISNKNTSPKLRKRNTNTSSTVKRSVSSTQKGAVDVSILKKNKSEDLSLNFDLKLGDGSETEPESDGPAQQPDIARRSVRIRNSAVAAAA